MKLRKAPPQGKIWPNLSPVVLPNPPASSKKCTSAFSGNSRRISLPNYREPTPEASPKDLYWNLHLVISSMLGTFAQHRRMGDFSKGICDENDVEDLSRRLIDFVSTDLKPESTLPPNEKNLGFLVFLGFSSRMPTHPTKPTEASGGDGFPPTLDYEN